MDKPYHRTTPLMGWASWNCFFTDISEERICTQAKALVDTGLAACGYEYVNTDDGFFGGRAADGTLLTHKTRFPRGLAPLAARIHALGLKAGIYSDGGDCTCGYYYNHAGKDGYNVGLYGHEESDLHRFFAEDGFDYIKVDWCGGVRLGLDEQTQYSKIGAIVEELRHTLRRTLVFNVCRWQFPGGWVTDVADSWRTGCDICPTFSSVLMQLDRVKPLARYCGPGHVNDPDMLQLGNGLSPIEEQTHFAMWCMLSAPLLIGCDLTAMRPDTLALLKNRALIALDQDPLCRQGYVIKSLDGGEVWLKELTPTADAPARRAVAFLNRGETPLDFTLSCAEAGLTGRLLSARDLLTDTPLHAADPADADEADAPAALRLSGGKVCAAAAPHGVAVVLLESDAAVPVPDTADRGEYRPEAPHFVSKREKSALLAQGAVLVDVRTPEEYDADHLEGAVCIPYCDIHSIAGEFLPDKTKPVLLYCATGKRCAQAQGSLVYLGYTHVFCLRLSDE